MKLKRFTDLHPFLFLYIMTFIIVFIFFMGSVCYYIIFYDEWFFDFRFLLMISILFFILFSLFIFSNEFDEMRKKSNILKLNIGLRAIYKMKKRLPKLICKHCLKTIIVKNIDLACPFCDANFTVTDTEKSIQMGDVFAKGVRSLVNESTMEKILFLECPACSSKIRNIDCYHCGKELDLFEEYDEYSIERDRYEPI